MDSSSSARESFSRRRFLEVSLAAGCATLASTVRAAEPIVRIGKPYMKLSLAAYSFNHELPENWPKPTRNQGTMTLMDFIDFCADMDLDGTELTSYYFPRELADGSPYVPRDYLMQIKEKTFRLGLDVSGTAIGNNFCVPEGEPLDQELALTRQWIDYAVEIGAPVIRIFAGYVPRGDSQDAALERCIDAINKSVEYAATKGVALALENHSGLTSTPDLILSIVRRVNDSPWFGVNLDTGNFHTEDPYHDLELIAPYALNVQVKVNMESTRKEKQPTDYKRVIDILKAANYRGYVVLEYEEKSPHVEVPIALRQLRKLIS